MTHSFDSRGEERESVCRYVRTVLVSNWYTVRLTDSVLAAVYVSWARLGSFQVRGGGGGRTKMMRIPELLILVLLRFLNHLWQAQEGATV